MIWLCGMLHALTHMYGIALIPLYLFIRKDFGLASDAEAAALVTTQGVAYFLPSYFFGILADKHNRRMLLTVGLVINSLAFIALAYAPTFRMALACVVLAGIGGGFFHPAATALVARLFPTGTGKALGKVGIGAGAGFSPAHFIAVGERKRPAGARPYWSWVLSASSLRLYSGCHRRMLSLRNKKSSRRLSRCFQPGRWLCRFWQYAPPWVSAISPAAA